MPQDSAPGICRDSDWQSNLDTEIQVGLYNDLEERTSTGLSVTFVFLKRVRPLFCLNHLRLTDHMDHFRKTSKGLSSGFRRPRSRLVSCFCQILKCL